MYQTLVPITTTSCNYWGPKRLSSNALTSCNTAKAEPSYVYIMGHSVPACIQEVLQVFYADLTTLE